MNMTISHWIFWGILGYFFPVFVRQIRSAEKLDQALLAMPRGIKECARWICMAELGQQLSIRQNYLKSLKFDLHFTGNVFVGFPRRIRSWCLLMQHFLACQVGTNQRHRVTSEKNSSEETQV